jgi:aryl-alcohol dehydrogenase-like predicted oxidoreductase
VRVTPTPTPTTVAVAVDDFDLRISRIGFGCAGLMRQPSARRRRDLIAAAIDAGITHFDVARMYGLGAAEGELGRAIQGRREQLTIATKFGIDASGALRRLGRLQAPARAVLRRSHGLRSVARGRQDRFVVPRRYDVEEARRSLETSLRALRVDHLDILFLHDPRPGDEIAGAELVAFLGQLRREGTIRAWGTHLDAASGLSVLRRLPEAGILQLRRDALADTGPRHPIGLAFDVTEGSGAITAWLRHNDRALSRWRDAIGAHPLDQPLLAALLLSRALANPQIAGVIHAATDHAELALAAELLRSPLPEEQVSAFSRCLTADLPSIRAGTGR